MGNLTVLGFARSLRKRSFNRSLLRATVELAPSSMRIEMFDLTAVPLYNGDVEGEGDPPGVRNCARAFSNPVPPWATDLLEYKLKDKRR